MGWRAAPPQAGGCCPMRPACSVYLDTVGGSLPHSSSPSSTQLERRWSVGLRISESPAFPAPVTSLIRNSSLLLTSIRDSLFPVTSCPCSKTLSSLRLGVHLTRLFLTPRAPGELKDGLLSENVRAQISEDIAVDAQQIKMIINEILMV